MAATTESAMEELTLKPGTRIVVQHLQKNPENNERLGEVVELLNEKGRYSIKVHGNNKLVNLKPLNVRVATEQDLAKLTSTNNDKPASSSSSTSAAVVPAKSISPVNALAPSPSPSPPPQGGGSMSMAERAMLQNREELAERAREVERLTPAVIKQSLKQARELKANPNQGLARGGRGVKVVRGGQQQHGQPSPTQIDQQILLLETILKVPGFQKLYAKVVRNGGQPSSQDVNRADDQLVVALAQFMYEDAKLSGGFQQAAAANNIPASEVEAQFKDLAEGGAENFRAHIKNQEDAMQAQMRDGGGAGGLMVKQGADMSKMTDAQLKRNSQQQVAMFKRDPQGMRKLMAKESSMINQLTDEQILEQLETVANMDAKEIRQMQEMSKEMQGSTTPGKQPGFEEIAKMGGEKISKLLQTNYEQYKRNPKAMGERMEPMVSQIPGMSGVGLEQQLEFMASLRPSTIDLFLTLVMPFYRAYNVADRVTGGRGRYVGMAFMLLLTYLLFVTLWFLLSRFVGPLIMAAYGTVTGRQHDPVSSSSSSLGGGSSSSSSSSSGNIVVEQEELKIGGKDGGDDGWD